VRCASRKKKKNKKAIRAVGSEGHAVSMQIFFFSRPAEDESTTMAAEIQSDKIEDRDSDELVYFVFGCSRRRQMSLNRMTMKPRNSTSVLILWLACLPRFDL
jgi:hypothetical protein